MDGTFQREMVIAVVVTYNPNSELLSSMLLALRSQVEKIVIIDNGSKVPICIPLELSECETIELLGLGNNFGLAFAQNVGIKLAIKEGGEFVLLMDQDSIPSENMVSILKAAHLRLSKLGNKVAAVGPRIVARNGVMKASFSHVSGLRVVRKLCDKNKVVSTDYLISSGCLVSKQALVSIGVMREDLFIDYIDIEWCLRARALGYDSFGVCDAVLSHALGDDPLVILGKQFPLHSPLRHYYIFRNAILLYLDPRISLHWRLVDAYRLCLKFAAYALFTENRAMHLSMMIRGLFDGFRGRGGQFTR